MKNFKSWMLISGILLLLCLQTVWSGALGRPKTVSFPIHKAFSRIPSVEDTFDIGGMTRQHVVSEGPCSGNGCNGGILIQQLPIDLKTNFPNLQGYNETTTTLIWLYQVKPTLVVRKNDWTGSDVVSIHGQLTKDRKVYYTVVPEAIVEPRLEWVNVETE